MTGDQKAQLAYCSALGRGWSCYWYEADPEDMTPAKLLIHRLGDGPEPSQNLLDYIATTLRCKPDRMEMGRTSDFKPVARLYFLDDPVPQCDPKEARRIAIRDSIEL